MSNCLGSCKTAVLNERDILRRYVPLVEEDMLAEPVVAAGEDHIVLVMTGGLQDVERIELRS